MPIRPFQKWLLWGSTVATGVTGAVYFWMDRYLEPVDAWAVINHPWQPVVLKAHILVAPAMLFMIGTLATEHVWKLYRARVKRARRTGLTTTTMVLPMVASGYLIQAVTNETVLGVVAWVHIVTGVAFVTALGAHQWVKGRRKLVRLEMARKEPTPRSEGSKRVAAAAPGRPKSERRVAARSPQPFP